MFSISKIVYNSSCSFTQKCNFFTTAFLSVIPNLVNPWIIDFRVIDHMTGCSKLFCSCSSCVAGNERVKIAYGSLSTIAKIRFVQLSHSLILYNAFVPNLSCNLLSISNITLDYKCRNNFYPSYCGF